jgi:hypothetical protein
MLITCGFSCEYSSITTRINLGYTNVIIEKKIDNFEQNCHNNLFSLSFDHSFHLIQSNFNHQPITLNIQRSPTMKIENFILEK